MIAFYIILAACPALLLTAVTFLVLIAVGIRKGDRRDLASPAQNCLDAMTRRITGTAARNDTGHDGETGNAHDSSPDYRAQLPVRGAAQ